MKAFFVILLAESFALSVSNGYLLKFENLNLEQKNIHAALCKTATEAAQKAKSQKNYFLPALRFVFKEKNIAFILSKTNDCFISKDEDSFTKCFSAHEQLCNEGSFFKPPITYCNDQLKSLNVYLNRLKEDTRYRLLDSEMIFIGNINSLHNETNTWINGLKKLLLIENTKAALPPLEKIEFHGFTTRDMCPCCFQHMLDFLKQANEKQNDTTNFWGALIQKLKAECIKIKEGTETIPITFYISSLVKLGRTEFDCSRYENYGNKCSEEEKIKLTMEIKAHGLHCIFLRKTETDGLSTIQANGQENKDAINNANTLKQEFLDDAFKTTLKGKTAMELQFPVTKI